MKILLALDSRASNQAGLGLLDPHRGHWSRFQIADTQEPFRRRGFRGSALLGDQLFVVSSAALYQYRVNLHDEGQPLAALVKTVRRPEWELGERAAADLHHVFFCRERGSLLIANSFMDCIDEVSLEGELRARHYLWDLSRSVGEIAFARVPGAADLTHVNHICAHGGDVYLTLGNCNGTRRGKVIRLGDGAVVVDGLEFPHDGVVSGDHFYLSQSGTSEISIYPLTNDSRFVAQESREDLPVQVRSDLWSGSFQWVRGIAVTEEHIICGVTQWRNETPFRPQIPPRLVFFGRESRQFEGELFLPPGDGFPVPSIFTIHVLPDSAGESLDFTKWQGLAPMPSAVEVADESASRPRVRVQCLYFHSPVDRMRLSDTWSSPVDSRCHVRVMPEGALWVDCRMHGAERFYLRTGAGPFEEVPSQPPPLKLEAGHEYELSAFLRQVRGGIATQLWVIQYDERERIGHVVREVAAGESSLAFRVDPRCRQVRVAFRFSGQGVVNLAPLNLFRVER